MEAEHGIVRDTDMVCWNDAGQEGTGRQAGAVDHDMLSAVADFMELANVGGDLAARIADNANVGRGDCRCNNGGRCEDHSGQRERASKGSLPFHWSHPLSLLSPLCLCVHYGKSSCIWKINSHCALRFFFAAVAASSVKRDGDAIREL